jgi:hypothetical protein
VTHAVLPAFVLVRRLDAAESAGAVIGRVASGVSGVRPAAAGIGVPYTTARGLVRRFAERAGELAVSFAALCAELGGEAVRPDPDRRLRWAAGAVGAAFEAASGLPGWAVLGAWLRRRGDRREPAGRQRVLTLADHRRQAFHASQELVTRRTSRTGTGGASDDG